MRMNKPEMEVVRFEVADVIATSGGPIIQYFEYWIQEGKAGLPDTEYLYNASTGVFGDLASLKSQIPNPEDGVVYSFDGTTWTRIG